MLELRSPYIILLFFTILGLTISLFGWRNAYFKLEDCVLWADRRRASGQPKAIGQQDELTDNDTKDLRIEPNLDLKYLIDF